MKGKVRLCLEMLIVFIILLLMVSVSNTFVKMGSNIPIKMIITLLIPTMMVLVPIMIYRIKKYHFSDFGFSRKKIGKQIMVGVGLFALTISFIILPLVLGVDKSNVLSFKPSSVSILVFYIIYLLIFIGFSEEIIFRGYFYRGIANLTNSALMAVIFSSILFGLFHYPNGQDIMKVIVTGLLGLIYGFARYKIKDCTILSLAIAHGLHDAVIILLSYLIL